MEMHPVFLFLDPYLIWFFRRTGWAEVDFILGTLAVASLTLLLGAITSWGASRLVRRRLEEVREEAKRYYDLSLTALAAGDRPAYEAANKLANEAFNKVFYMQVALSATFFWPVFLALGWMQARFFEVEFAIPGTPWSLSYLGVFILLYVAAYFLFKGLKKRWLMLRPHTSPPPQPLQT